jgi:hypothetical protein
VQSARPCARSGSGSGAIATARCLEHHSTARTATGSTCGATRCYAVIPTLTLTLTPTGSTG